MAELNDDTQALSLRVDHIEEEHDEDELVDKAKDRVLDHLRTSMSVSID
jgi:predicted small metal-binding protein